MDELLKRREELLKAKLEIEKKLKRASKLKGTSKESNFERLSRIEEEEAVSNDKFLDLQLDQKSGTLAVLQSDRLTLKCIISSDPIRFIDLPECFDADEMIFEFGLVVLSGVESSSKCALLSVERLQWTFLPVDEGFKVIKIFRVDSSDAALFVFFNDKLKQIRIFKGYEVISSINDVEAVFTSKESLDTMLLLKTDSLLTICNLLNIKDEVVFIPRLAKYSSSVFNPKNIVYYNYDSDASLFFVLHERIIGKLKILVSGVDCAGATEIASISVSKGLSWLSVRNPFILYQDSKQILHLLSLFTLEKLGEFQFDTKIENFAFLSGENLVLVGMNGLVYHVHVTGNQS